MSCLIMFAKFWCLFFEFDWNYVAAFVICLFSGMSVESLGMVLVI